jgi:hypothetical protein
MTRYLKTAVLICALVVTSAHAQPTAQLMGGKTSVRLDPGFVNALVSLGVAPSAISPGTLNLRSRFVRYPIVGGVIDLDTLVGDLFHTGGLTLEAHDTKVSLYNFVITTTGDAPVLTGVAAVNGSVVDRIPLFDLELTKDPRVTKWGGLNVWRVKVTLNEVAAETLNSVFGVTAFEGGFSVGKAFLRTHITGVEYEDSDQESDERGEEDD